MEIRKRRGEYIELIHGNRRRLEHRVVAERSIGRKLRKDEVVHHRNEIKTDNRPENLQVTTRARHSRYHAKTRPRKKGGKFRKTQKVLLKRKSGKVNPLSHFLKILK